MPKEDRSDWVAVAPEFASTASSEPKIKPPTSAFTFFQRDVSEQVKAEYMASHEKFQVGEFSKLLRERWNELEDDKKEHYEDLARQDRMRFASESHAADVAAMERRERLQKEREMILLNDDYDDDDEDYDDTAGPKRTTRRQLAKKERKRERHDKKQKKMMERKQRNPDDEEFVEDEDDEDESVESYEGESDSDDSAHARKKKAAPRQLSQKQIELKEKRQREKQEKEAVIFERQEDVRKEKAQQAKRRLEFLLKQSNIFSHFGRVKQDQAKYGISTKVKRSEDPKDGSARSSVDGSVQEDEDLEEADTHDATFLTSQPTTLGFGKMRQYQLEGLNWMIRLQENGVNGILADEVSMRNRKRSSEM